MSFKINDDVIRISDGVHMRVVAVGPRDGGKAIITCEYQIEENVKKECFIESDLQLIDPNLLPIQMVNMDPDKLDLDNY